MWSRKHNCERQMLYETMNDYENIEVGCVWGPENVFRSNANRWDKMRQYDGIAVVTGSREAPLPTVESLQLRCQGADPGLVAGDTSNGTLNIQDLGEDPLRPPECRLTLAAF